MPPDGKNMKHTFLFTALVAIFAALLTGCPGKENGKDGKGGGSSRADVIKGLDNFGFEKAPQLGPVLKDFLLAIYDKKYDDAWNMLNKASQKEAAKELAGEVAELRESIASMEAKISDAKTPQENKNWYKSQLDVKKARLGELMPLIGDGGKYFTYLMGNSDVGKSFQDIADGQTKVKIIGETISGDKGYISEEAGERAAEQKLLFVMEEGKWKFDFYNTSAAPPASAPATAGQNNP
jgi:predicted small secreted protein